MQPIEQRHSLQSNQRLGDATHAPAFAGASAGEAAQGPTAAAIANAVFDALGLRARDLPLTAERLRQMA